MNKRKFKDLKRIARDIYFNKLCATVLLPNGIRSLFYRLGGISIEKKVTICPHCFLGSKHLKIGEGSFLNYNVWLNTAGGIKIGKQCNIACNVMFITSTHSIGNEDRRAGIGQTYGIEVGDGTWIGAGTVILPGIKIGNGCIIGAGSVVTKDCKENCVYAGNPAKVIRQLPESVSSTTN